MSSMYRVAGYAENSSCGGVFPGILPEPLNLNQLGKPLILRTEGSYYSQSPLFLRGKDGGGHLQKTAFVSCEVFSITHDFPPSGTTSGSG